MMSRFVQEVGGAQIPMMSRFVHEQLHLNSSWYRIIPMKQRPCPDMTEILLTGTFNKTYAYGSFVRKADGSDTVFL